MLDGNDEPLLYVPQRLEGRPRRHKQYAHQDYNGLELVDDDAQAA